MKKILTLVALIGMLMASMSAMDPKPEVARVGYQAPNFILHTGSDSEISLQQYRGKAVILTLWSSADAESRLANQRDQAEAKRRGIAHLSVNLDRSEKLCRQISSIDNVRSVFCPDRDREQIAKQWGIDLNESTGLSSWLIGADGTIRQML